MSDLPDKPASAWVWYFIGIWVLISVALIMLGTGTAHAQQQCVRMDQLMRGMTEVLHERKIWQGVKNTPLGPIETFLFQSESGAWTIVDVVGKDAAGKAVGCFVAVGTNGVPNELGRGV